MSHTIHQGITAGQHKQREFVSSTADYWEKRLAERWGIEGVGNIGLGIAYNKWQYKQRKQVFLRGLSTIAANLRDAAVLDVGSGIGFWLNVWQGLGVRSLTGVDITNVSVSNLSAAFPDVRMLRLDISSSEAREVLKEQFDFISAMDVLSHITEESNFSAAIANISRLLKPGGHFVFSENLPHRDKDQNFNSIQANRTLGNVTTKLEQEGLRIVLRIPIFFTMMTPLDTRTDLPRKAWRLFMLPVRVFPWFGGIYGAALYAADSVLSKVFKEGPSTELVICVKR